MAAAASQPTTIDAYIAGFPVEVQEILGKVRELIRKEAPEAEEAIKYQIPTFVLNGNLVHFAAFKKHIGLYPTPSGIAAFERELTAYTNAKGSVQFPLDRPIPYSLIRRIVAFRVTEVRGKQQAKPARKASTKAPTATKKAPQSKKTSSGIVSPSRTKQK